jgi:aspartate aminotransferase
MRSSATVAINERCNELIAQGRHIHKLGLGQSPFPVPAFVVEALRANAWRKDYEPVKGVHELRAAVASYHQRKSGIRCTASDVLIGPGSKELMFLLQIVYYGELVVPTPAWVSYAPQAQIVGRRVSFLATRKETGWRLGPEQLHELCRLDPDRPRIVVLNYPSNPTGGSYDVEELRELARVARRFRVVLLSDEIYGELNHAGEHVSVASFYREGTIISGGLSKWCGAGGWRLGTFAFPRGLNWLLNAMAAVASETYTSVSSPIQHAAIRAFVGGAEMHRYLVSARKVLSALARKAVEILRVGGVDVLAPAGAFYLFPDFTPLADRLHKRGITTSVKLCERLLEETGVAILPGSDFGRPVEELTARIAYVNFDGERALDAAKSFPPHEELPDSFLSEHCPETLEALQRIPIWLETGKVALPERKRHPGKGSLDGKPPRKRAPARAPRDVPERPSIRELLAALFGPRKRR